MVSTIDDRGQRTVCLPPGEGAESERSETVSGTFVFSGKTRPVGGPLSRPSVGVAEVERPTVMGGGKPGNEIPKGRRAVLKAESGFCHRFLLSG